MGKHYRKEVKREGVRLFEAGKTHAEITAELGIRAYREKGAEAFDERLKKGTRGRRPKKENTKAYIARLEMEVALLKKFHTELQRKQLAVRNIGRSITTEESTR